MSALGTTAKVITLSEQRELSEAARALLNDKAFGHVFLTLQQRYVGQLIGLPHGSPIQEELCSRLRTLEIILAELGTLLTDHREAAKRARNG